MLAYTFEQIAGYCKHTDSEGRVWRLRIRPLSELPALEDDCKALASAGCVPAALDAFLADNVTNWKAGTRMSISDAAELINAIMAENAGGADDPKKKTEVHDPQSWGKALCSLATECGFTPASVLAMTSYQMKALMQGFEHRATEDYKATRGDLVRDLRKKYGGGGVR